MKNPQHALAFEVMSRTFPRMKRRGYTFHRTEDAMEIRRPNGETAITARIGPSDVKRERADAVEDLWRRS